MRRCVVRSEVETEGHDIDHARILRRMERGFV